MSQAGVVGINRSDNTIAVSEEEAIENVRKSHWWYDEGTGYDHHKIRYPLTFTAKIIDEQ